MTLLKAEFTWLCPQYRFWIQRETMSAVNTSTLTAQYSVENWPELKSASHSNTCAQSNLTEITSASGFAIALWTLRLEVLFIASARFSNTPKRKNDVSSNQPLALCRWHTLLKKMLNSSDNSKPAGESFLWVCLKTSTKIYLAERANKCLSNIDDQREARNATRWQNVKIIYSGPSAARHNHTCSARQPAIKHCYPNL